LIRQCCPVSCYLIGGCCPVTEIMLLDWTVDGDFLSQFDKGGLQRSRYGSL
jgi:hypothetical protein